MAFSTEAEQNGRSGGQRRDSGYEAATQADVSHQGLKDFTLAAVANFNGQAALATYMFAPFNERHRGTIMVRFGERKSKTVVTSVMPRRKRSQFSKQKLFLSRRCGGEPLLSFHFIYRSASSTSLSQSGRLSTSRGLGPSAAPTMPSFSMRSMRCAARP